MVWVIAFGELFFGDLWCVVWGYGGMRTHFSLLNPSFALVRSCTSCCLRETLQCILPVLRVAEPDVSDTPLTLRIPPPSPASFVFLKTVASAPPNGMPAPAPHAVVLRK